MPGQEVGSASQNNFLALETHSSLNRTSFPVVVPFMNQSYSGPVSCSASIASYIQVDMSGVSLVNLVEVTAFKKQIAT